MSLLTAQNVALTQWFIDQNPSEITIIRDVRSSDGAGGTVVTGETTLPPQTARLVGIKPMRGHTLVMSVTRDGEQVVANSTLITMPDADVQAQDRFTMNGDTDHVYEILHVENHPEWRNRAEVYLHGGG